MLELSIALIIIGVLVGMSMSFGVGMIESARRTQTMNKLHQIEETLQDYRNAHNRLPCPADPRLADSDNHVGLEADNPGKCLGGTIAAPVWNVGGLVVEGTVPVRTLGLPDTFMYDGWGRRFAYAVPVVATDIDAFRTLRLDNNYYLAVYANGGFTRTDGIIYMLLSYGPLGHGGYLSTGVRYNGHSTNQNEKMNCHCDQNANETGYTASYLQRPRSENPTEGTFDQIITYKTRWQMMNHEDELMQLYTGPALVAGFAMPAPNRPYPFLFQGSLLNQWLSPLTPVANTTTRYNVAFLPHNSAILSISETGCALYPITGNTIGSAAAQPPNCPGRDANTRMAISDSGYLAITQNGSPYIKLWKSNGVNSFAELSLLQDGPPSVPDSLSMSDDYLLASKNGGGGYLKLYHRGGDNFTAGVQPPSIPGNIVSSAISPTETYIAATVDGNPARIYLWSINSSASITSLPTISITGNTVPKGITFSPDGKYMAVGGVAENMVIYKIDANDAFTRLTAPTGWLSAAGTAGINFAFSRDSNYVIMATADEQKSLVLFRQVDALHYKYVNIPNVPGTGGPYTNGVTVQFAH
jgi:type II secretory pathway pseudopilin PulG